MSDLILENDAELGEWLESSSDAYYIFAPIDSEWSKYLNSLDNYVLTTPIQWDQVNPITLATAYITVLKSDVPYTDLFLDYASSALAYHDLQAVLPDPLLGELMRMVRTHTKAVGPVRHHDHQPDPKLVRQLDAVASKPYSPGRMVLDWRYARPYDYDALNPEYKGRVLSELTDEILENSIPLPSSDPYCNSPLCQNLMLIDKFAHSGPFGGLIGTIAIARGGDASGVLMALEGAEPIDDLLNAPEIAMSMKLGAFRTPPAVRRGRRRPSNRSRVCRRSRSGATLSIPTVQGVDVRDNFHFWESLDNKNRRMKNMFGLLGHPDEVAKSRNKHHQRSVSGHTGDSAAHGIARDFGAPGDWRNLSAMNGRQNVGTFAELENLWRKQIRDGSKVWVWAIDVFPEQQGPQPPLNPMTSGGMRVPLPRGEKRAELQQRPLRRVVRWVEQKPNGELSMETLTFVNTHTPDSRQQRNVPPTPNGPGGTVHAMPNMGDAQKVLSVIPPGGRISSEELQRRTGLNWGRLDAALEQLGAQGKVTLHRQPGHGEIKVGPDPIIAVEKP